MSADAGVLAGCVIGGCADQATLDNGVPLTGLSGNTGAQFTESFFLPAEASAVMVKTNSRDVYLQIMDQQGDTVGICSGGIDSGCFASGLSSGLYYVQGVLDNGIADFSLAASWVVRRLPRFTAANQNWVYLRSWEMFMWNHSM